MCFAEHPHLARSLGQAIDTEQNVGMHVKGVKEVTNLPTSALDAAASGMGHVVVIAGEPRVG
jgi:hypothetical protein